MSGSRINKDLLESNEKASSQSRRMPDFGQRPSRVARMDANEKLNRIGQQLKAKEDDFSTYQKENDRKPRITQIDEDDQEMES